MVAGAAALVKQAHPDYQAAQIKSALVNAAAQDVTTDDLGNLVDVQWMGAGRLDAGAAAGATVVADPATISFGYVKTGTLPATRTLMLTNRGTISLTLSVAVVPQVETPNASVAVDRTEVTLARGGAALLRITLSGTMPAAGAYSGAVTARGGGVSLRMPYLFLVGDGVPYNANLVIGAIQGTPGQNGGPVLVQVTDRFGVPVADTAVDFSVSPRGAASFLSVAGEPACTTTGTRGAVACNTDNYGLAYASVLLGEQPNTKLLVTAATQAAGASFSVQGYILPQPAIEAGGVKDAAAFQATVAPGSYAAIIGSNLVDRSLLTSPGGDLATTAVLPLTLDSVTVSFDVPSAGISVPARMFYAGPDQVNVQVPWELAGQSAALVKVILNEAYGTPVFSNLVTVPLADFTPALFESGGVAAARDRDAMQITTAHPAVRGQVVSLYGNGFGPVTNQPATGDPAPSRPLAETTTLPVVTIGGRQAQVLYSGLAPGTAAEYQINAIVPAEIEAGNAQVTVTIGGQTSPATSLPVR